MHRRKLLILAGAALAGAAVGVPFATAVAQEATSPPCPMMGAGHPMMGAGWMGQAGPRGMWGGPGAGAASTFDMGRHFIEEMIPHHEDAIRMADLALVRAEHQEILDLAASIKQTQSAEIAQMRQWHQEWYGAEPGQSRMAQMPNMPGHDLTALEGATSFDKVFVEQMVPHHQMAVMMTGHMAGGVQQPELKALMEAMGASQAAEIALMEGWYQSWYGVALPRTAPMGPGRGPGMMGPGMRGRGMGPGMMMDPGMMGSGMGPGMMWGGGQPPCIAPSQAP